MPQLDFRQAMRVMAAIGIHAMAACSAHARRHEFAIRAACGAPPGDLIGRELATELWPVPAGVAGGLVAAIAARSLGGMLYSIAPSDGRTSVSVATALVAIACVAIAVPAARAGRTDRAVLRRS